MSDRQPKASRTYLEMREPACLLQARVPDASCRVERILECPPSFWRFLYTEVGRGHGWIDRLPWSADDIRAYLADPAVSLWLMSVHGAPAGYFELRNTPDGATEIAYFGVLKDFHGRGLGGHLLTQAVQRAWEAGASRVWVHTSTLDHPAALPNYLKRGFTVYKTETYVVRV
jgi:GNAT superfamily N-acetyltransferase